MRCRSASRTAFPDRRILDGGLERPPYVKMKNTIWGLLLLLAVLHQDVWFWEDSTLILDFLPIGMAWHIGISLAAAVLWVLATKYCWPNLVTDENPATGGTEAGQ